MVLKLKGLNSIVKSKQEQAYRALGAYGSGGGSIVVYKWKVGY
jgi:hypothetical protein